ncbi:patched domain-containing protein [Anaeramoeba flamelloides]|uniref:Patched domain-containing protein n=1 Tax=Anaeramoeba flamelloides TaxID=1746091 RepID=A0ABQ8YBI7_9EUKA|nr:patched domain-containing protein [Anaeramoeba flamelloides]
MSRWTKFCATFEEKLGEKLGKFSGIINDHPYISLLIVLVIILASMGGFYFQETENEVTKIYVPQDAPILVNERYFNKKWDFLPKYEAIWLTSDPIGDNVITKESIDLMFEYDKKVKELEITYNDKKYGFYDLCYVNPITNKCQINGILEFWNFNQSLVEEDKILEVITDQKNIVTGQYLDESTVMMDIEKNDDGEIIGGVVLILNYAMENIDDNAKPLEKWELEFIDELLEIKNQLEKDNSKHKLIFNANSSINNEVGKASASNPVTYIIGYILMGLVLWLTIGNFKSTLTSHLYLSIGALVTIAFSVLCGFGLGGYFIKNTSLVSVLIFLMLALGVDDVYIIVKNFDLTDISLNPRDRLTLTLKNSTSIVVTTLTDVAVLLIGLSSPFDATVYFCGYGCCCIFFVIFFQFTLFPIMLSFEAKRIHHQHNAFLPCMRIKTNNFDKKEQKKEKKKKKKDVEISDSDPNSSTTFDSDTDSNTDTKEKNTKKNKGNESKLKLDFFQRFLKEKYGPFILNKKVSIFIIIIFLAYFGASIYFATQVEEGFEETSVLTYDSYLQDMFKVLNKYYLGNGQDFYIVIKEDTKYHEAETKNQLLKLIEDLKKTEKWVSRGPYGWYEDYLNYLQTEDDAPTLDSDGLPVNPDEFYSYLQDSFLQNSDYIHYKLISDIIFNENEDDINKQIEVSRLNFVSTDLSKTNDRVDFMYDISDITTNSEIDCFEYNEFYYLVEQYSIVKQSTLMSVGLAILAVLLLAFIFFIYPTNAILISLTIIMIDVDLYGFLWLVGLKIEPVSSVCLIMSVGFAVDYAAHIIHSYTTAKQKTRKEKVIHSLTQIGSSVLLGGFTTFLGLTPVLIFATSEIFRTLVKILYATIVSGILHGFVFLPVILQFLGAKGNTSIINKKKKSNSQSDSDVRDDSDDSDNSDGSDVGDSIPLDKMKKSKNSDSNSESGSSSKTDTTQSNSHTQRNTHDSSSPTSFSSE